MYAAYLMIRSDSDSVCKFDLYFVPNCLIYIKLTILLIFCFIFLDQSIFSITVSQILGPFEEHCHSQDSLQSMATVNYEIDTVQE